MRTSKILHPFGIHCLHFVHGYGRLLSTVGKGIKERANKAVKPGGESRKLLLTYSDESATQYSCDSNRWGCLSRGKNCSRKERKRWWLC